MVSVSLLWDLEGNVYWAPVLNQASCKALCVLSHWIITILIRDKSCFCFVLFFKWGLNNFPRSQLINDQGNLNSGLPGSQMSVLLSTLCFMVYFWHICFLVGAILMAGASLYSFSDLIVSNIVPGRGTPMAFNKCLLFWISWKRAPGPWVGADKIIAEIPKVCNFSPKGGEQKLVTCSTSIPV